MNKKEHKKKEAIIIYTIPTDRCYQELESINKKAKVNELKRIVTRLGNI